MPFTPDYDHVAREAAEAPPRQVTRDLLMHHHANRNLLELGFNAFCFYLVLVLVCAKILPGPALLAMIVFSSRSLLIYHELAHCRDRIPFVLEVVPFLIGPFSAGYPEFRRVHLRHHAHLNTPQDGDWWLNKGGIIRGLPCAVFYSEHQLFKAWRDGPISPVGRRRMFVGALVRLLLFWGALSLLGLPLIMWYFAPYRLLLGLQYFFFTYLLHRRGETWGTFPIRLHPFLQASAGKLLVGSKWMDAVHFHDVHHAYPTVAIQNLHLLANNVRAVRGSAVPE